MGRQIFSGPSNEYGRLGKLVDDAYHRQHAAAYSGLP
jgi:hypothetical protein